MHKNKEKTIAQSLRDRADYAKNGEKTEDGEYIYSYECNAGIADHEFLSARSEYLRRNISGEDVASKQQKVKRSEKSFDMLLDIQKIIAKGKGAGYER